MRLKLPGYMTDETEGIARDQLMEKLPVKYDSAMKNKTRILLFVAAWRDLEDNMLSEISQTERDK